MYCLLIFPHQIRELFGVRREKRGTSQDANMMESVIPAPQKNVPDPQPVPGKESGQGLKSEN